ncbi:MAG: cytochrome P450 [Pseudomonadota bacterium]
MTSELSFHSKPIGSSGVQGRVTNKKPPLIPGRPVIGYLPEYRQDAVKLFRDMADRGGDICRFRVGPRIVTLINDPELISHVLKTKWRQYPKSVNYEEVGLLLGGRLATSDGADWERFRKRSRAALGRKNFGALPKIIAESINDLLPLENMISDHVQQLDVYELGMRLSARISSQLFFGSDIKEQTNTLEQSLRKGFAFVSGRVEAMVRLPMWIPLPSHTAFKKNTRLVEGIVSDLIVRARTGQARGSGMLRDLILSAQEDGDSEDQIDREVLNEAVFLYIGSFETTGATVAWILFLLSTHPQILADLQAELDTALGDDLVELEDLSRLKLLGAIVQEALRLYPTIWLMSRTASEDDTLGGYHIDAGSMVMVSPYMLHRRADLWPDPDAFRPERFLNAADWRRDGYLPFSLGPHACVGSHLATVELQMITASLLKNRRFKLCAGETGLHRSGVTLTPAGGLRMTVSRRV